MTTRIRRWPGNERSAKPWIIEDLASQRRVATSELPARLVTTLSAMGTATRDDLLAAVRAPGNGGDQVLVTAAAQRAVDALARTGVIQEVGEATSPSTTTGSAKEETYRTIRRRWEARDWSAAALFQVHTDDYPFLDYSRDGRGTDVERMTARAVDERDDIRYKQYPEVRESVSLPSPHDVPVVGPPAWQGPTTQGAPRFDDLAPVFSLIFGKTGEVQLPWPNSLPAYQRTSPSGGSRHPVEAYLLNLELADLAPGWWHVRWPEPALDRVGGPVTEDEARQLLPGAVGRAPFRVAASIVFTIDFTRNMYRYREPRTFRAVFMDAGHLVGMTELALATAGYRSFTHHGLDIDALDQALGLDPLVEGCASAVSIAG
jgi:SagB-type dehydrogenase family enzyme